MIRHVSKAAAALALVTVALTVVGCGSSANTLILYNGQHEQTTDALVAGFEKATGINVEVRSDDEDTLADELLTEGSNSPADLIYTENSPVLQFLVDRGMLAQINGSTLAHTPSKYRSPVGEWVGVSARVSVLIYNPHLISESQLPTSVSQLADRRQARVRRRRDRLPADRHLLRPDLRPGRHAQMA